MRWREGEPDIDGQPRYLISDTGYRCLRYCTSGPSRVELVAAYPPRGDILSVRESMQEAQRACEEHARRGRR